MSWLQKGLVVTATVSLFGSINIAHAQTPEGKKYLEALMVATLYADGVLTPQEKSMLNISDQDLQSLKEVEELRTVPLTETIEFLMTESGLDPNVTYSPEDRANELIMMMAMVAGIDGELSKAEIQFLLDVSQKMNSPQTEAQLQAQFQVQLQELKDFENQAKAAEVSVNLVGLQTALDMYQTSTGQYIAAEPYPSCDSVGQLRPWVVAESGGFETLGWRPDGSVRGCYRIELTSNGADYKIIGEIDVDNDGQKRIYEATKYTKPRLITDPSIY